MLEEVTLDANTLMGNEPLQKGDEALYVRFFTRAKEDPKRSAEEGRPIYRDVEYVHIRLPGDKLTEVERPATARDRGRFRRHYEAFKSGRGDAVSGTPLAKWPGVQASQVEELKYFNIHTVEALAGMPDGNLANVGNITHLKRSAQDWLDAAKGRAPAEQLRSELEKRDLELDAMRKQLAAISEQMATQAEPKRKGKQIPE